MLGPLINSLRPIPIHPRFVRWLPGDSSRFGPPRRALPTTDYLARHGGSVRCLPGATNVSFTPLQRVGRVPITIDSGLHENLPDDFVFEIANSRLLGPDGWVVGAADSFLPETSFWTFSATRNRLHQHPIYARKKAFAERFLPGRTLSLASEHSIGSPHHLLSDGLARLPLVLSSGYRTNEFDWVYLPRPVGHNIEALVERLGIARDRVLDWQPQVDLRCEHLVACRFPGLPGNPPPQAIRFWQQRAMGDDGTPGEGRIYLSRQNARRCLADAAPIERLLANAGFTTCYPDRDPLTVRHCQRARYIVALDGSNLANLVFCAPGTRVLVLCPTGFPNPPYTLTLASHCGHHLIACGVERFDESPRTCVDLADFKQALELLLAT